MINVYYASLVYFIGGTHILLHSFINTKDPMYVDLVRLTCKIHTLFTSLNVDFIAVFEEYLT